jgi:amino acid transporter
VHMSDHQGPLPADQEPSDASLDAGRQDDAAYLRKLGYTQELHRSLGTFASFAVQFSLIGVSIGIFLLFGYGLSIGGPREIIPFVVGGAGQMIVGLSVAALVSAYPLAGGTYQIIRRLVSRALAWQAGWWLALALIAGISSLAVGIAPYIGPAFGMEHPSYRQTMLIAAGTIIVITLINIISVRVASGINIVGVICEMLGLSTVVVLLLIKGTVQPFSVLGNSGGTGSGWGYLVPFLFVLLMPAFIISSFDSTGHTGEETKNAATAAPKGVVIANFGAYFYAIIVLVIFTLCIPSIRNAMASSTPVIYVVDHRLGHNFANALTGVVCVSFLVCMEICELTAARIIWAQARDGDFPFAPWMHKLGRNRVPIRASIICGLFAFVLCLYSSLLTVLAGVVAVAYSVAYGVVVAAGIIGTRRGTLPKHPWHYGRFGPIIDWLALAWSLILTGVLIYQNPKQVGGGFLAFGIALGALLYYVVLPRTRGKVPSAAATTPQMAPGTTSEVG